MDANPELRIRELEERVTALERLVAELKARLTTLGLRVD